MACPPFFFSPTDLWFAEDTQRRDPLRPIVVVIGSPTHQLARELARILAPLAGRSSSHVKISSDFMDQIRQASLEETDVMESFDVASLFTRVPVNEVLVVIYQRLQNDATLKD